MFVPMAAEGWSTEQTKSEIMSIRQIGRFTCEYVACKAIIVFFRRLSSQSPAIPLPVVPSIFKAQLSTAEQQNKDITAHHSVSI